MTLPEFGLPKSSRFRMRMTATLLNTHRGVVLWWRIETASAIKQPPYAHQLT